MSATCETCGHWMLTRNVSVDGTLGICERISASVAYEIPSHPTHPTLYLFPGGGPSDVVITPADFGCILHAAHLARL